MRIIVCGGRYFSDRSVVFWALDLLHSRREIMLVIHGDCRGADRLARSWARRHEVPDLSFRAQWHRHGDAAGPIRNRQMLEDGWMGKIDGVIAFPGGAGTADMVQQAALRGLKIWRPVRADGSRDQPAGISCVA